MQSQLQVFFAILPISGRTELRSINTAWLPSKVQNGRLRSPFFRDDTLSAGTSVSEKAKCLTTAKDKKSKLFAVTFPFKKTTFNRCKNDMTIWWEASLWRSVTTPVWKISTTPLLYHKFSDHESIYPDFSVKWLKVTEIVEQYLDNLLTKRDYEGERIHPPYKGLFQW